MSIEKKNYSNNIYYATKDYDIITNMQLARSYFLVTGERIDAFDIEVLEQRALPIMNGVLRRVDNPSWKVLAEHGHKVKAIKIYADSHDCSLEIAKETVEYYIGSIKNRRRKNGKPNNEGNETSSVNDVQQFGMAEEMSENEAETDSCYIQKTSEEIADGVNE